ncbi:MAG: anti-sigma factor family protein [Candidatus Promineifilaceae bacterium]|jgi:predicted anti-sigma-YlaC factor YlaD
MHEHKKDCQLLLEDLSIYLEGEASDAVCAEIEHHLRECDDCRVVVDTLNQTLHLYHTLPQPDMPEDLRERLYKSLDLEPYFTPKS